MKLLCSDAESRRIILPPLPSQLSTTNPALMAVHVIYDATNPRGHAQVILQLVMLGISWPTIIARFVARGIINSLGTDDFLILSAQVTYIKRLSCILCSQRFAD
jgi:hypothetical protein